MPGPDSQETPPLKGVRVLDLSSPIGPYCTRLLADLGAEVALIEPPEGDPYRRLGPHRTGAAEPESSLAFGYYHASKRSVVLDLDRAADQAKLRRLAEAADAIVVSPNPARPLWGFSVEERNLEWAPDHAIVCSITPFGIGGPYWHRPFTHATAFAQSGLMAGTGPPGEPPVAMPADILWHDASVFAAIGVLGALAVRDDIGGQFIDVSAQEVAAHQFIALAAYHAQGQPPGQRVTGSLIPPSGVWECADGRIDVAAYADRHWPAFLEMTGHPDQLSEPSLADMAVRRQIFDGLAPVIQAVLADHKRDDLFDRGQRAGLPVCLRNTPAEFVADRQLAERNYWVNLARSGEPPFPAPGPPVLTRPQVFRPAVGAPRLAEHGEEPFAAPAAPHTGGRDATDPDAPDASAARAAPLAGTRVLSLGAFVAGNVCAQILASLGAEVVKVESPDRPEALRGEAYNDALTLAVEPSGATNTPMNAQLTWGLKNIGMDMSHAGARRAFRALAAEADIVIENFAGSVMADWGVAFDDLAGLNPRLIMISMSGYGRTGPRASYRAYASNIASFTGLTEVWWTSATFTDYIAAAHTSLAALAALSLRGDATAPGCPVFIDAAQPEAFAAMAARIYLGPLVNGKDAVAAPRAGVDMPLTHVTQCEGDDRWALLEIEDLEQWNAVCGLVGRADLAARAASALDHQALIDSVDKWAAKRTPRTVAHVLGRIGVPAASVATSEEVYDDAQLRSRGSLVEVHHRDLGRLVIPAVPLRAQPGGGSLPVPPARLGEHSREILERWGGFSGTEVEELIEAGAVFQSDVT